MPIRSAGQESDINSVAELTKHIESKLLCWTRSSGKFLLSKHQEKKKVANTGGDVEAAESAGWLPDRRWLPVVARQKETCDARGGGGGWLQKGPTCTCTVPYSC
jgi:hypothetical protein